MSKSLRPLEAKFLYNLLVLCLDLIQVFFYEEKIMFLTSLDLTICVIQKLFENAFALVQVNLTLSYIQELTKYNVQMAVF